MCICCIHIIYSCSSCIKRQGRLWRHTKTTRQGVRSDDQKTNPSSTGEARAVQVMACETLKFVCLHHYLWVIELQRVETPDVPFQFLGMSVLPIMVSLSVEPSNEHNRESLKLLIPCQSWPELMLGGFLSGDNPKLNEQSPNLKTIPNIQLVSVP